jgi:penicillin-binding protein 1A
MMTFLRAVTSKGTGAAAAQLNHPVGGKTGTTSDYTDAWFLGFSPSVTCGVWVGYDSRESLGEKETGAKAALPIWMTWMRAAIAGKDNEQFPGDEDSSSQLDKASVALPARPSPPPAAKLVKASALVNPPANPAIPATATKPPTQPAAPAVKLTAATPATAPRVRPALPPQQPPITPHPIVKPALAPTPQP